MLNVVAHGVPYMALVYATEQKKSYKKNWFLEVAILEFWRSYFCRNFVCIGLQEGFWNGLVWHEYDEFFAFFPNINLTDNLLLSITIALLSMPQLTHYILDGYIWKRGF